MLGKFEEDPDVTCSKHRRMQEADASNPLPSRYGFRCTKACKAQVHAIAPHAVGRVLRIACYFCPATDWLCIP